MMFCFNKRLHDLLLLCVMKHCNSSINQILCLLTIKANLGIKALFPEESQPINTKRKVANRIYLSLFFLLYLFSFGASFFLWLVLPNLSVKITILINVIYCFSALSNLSYYMFIVPVPEE